MVFRLSATIKPDIRCTVIVIIALAGLGVHSTCQIWLSIPSFVLLFPHLWVLFPPFFSFVGVRTHAHMPTLGGRSCERDGCMAYKTEGNLISVNEDAEVANFT